MPIAIARLQVSADTSWPPYFGSVVMGYPLLRSITTSLFPTPTCIRGRGCIGRFLALDPASIFKQAGKAALRQAVLWMREHQNAEVTEQGATLVISFPGIGLDLPLCGGDRS